MEIDFYKLTREHFESNLVLDKSAAKERRTLYSGLAALTHAIENHLNQILKAVQENGADKQRRPAGKGHRSRIPV